jgi:CubicO group peptidase (beta-lactamase class C family)
LESPCSEPDVATEDDALRLVTLQRGVDFAPGAEWSYSNTGYFLLSYVIKRVSGNSLAAFSKERIFDPLGMKDTTTFDDHTMVVPRRATAYKRRDDGSFAVEWKTSLTPIERDAFAGGPGALLFERDAKKRVHAMVATLGGRRAVRWTKR